MAYYIRIKYHGYIGYAKLTNKQGTRFELVASREEATPFLYESVANQYHRKIMLRPGITRSRILNGTKE